LSVTLLIGCGWVLREQQSSARDDLIQRFDLRAQVGARFLESYVDDLTTREQHLAAITLNAHTVTQRSFERVAATLGFPTAVLLDAEGRVLRAVPEETYLTGFDLAATSAYLREAVAGLAAVSDAEPSAGTSSPAVGLAVPFETWGGRKVFAGTLTVDGMSLGTSYLRNLTPLKGASVWLVDSRGRTINSSSDSLITTDLLQREDAELSAALGRASKGSYETSQGTNLFTSFTVEGTPWRLVVSAPEPQVLLAVAGASTTLPWVVFAGLVAAVAIGLVLQRRLAQSKARELDQVGKLAITDVLSGLHNRRGYELLAEQVLRDSRRDGRSAAVMLFDMDGLKQINDRLGHAVGNEAIVAAAGLLRSTFRESDVVARIGGDEFCVVGTLTGALDGAAQLRRLDDALRLFNEREGAAFHLALSGGVALYDPTDPKSLADLEAEADARMYQEKRSARVGMAQSPPPSVAV
jgi:diguanylate cyclase (GGDEF)-like protein